MKIPIPNKSFVHPIINLSKSHKNYIINKNITGEYSINLNYNEFNIHCKFNKQQILTDNMNILLKTYINDNKIYEHIKISNKNNNIYSMLYILSIQNKIILEEYIKDKSYENIVKYNIENNDTNLKEIKNNILKKINNKI